MIYEYKTIKINPSKSSMIMKPIETEEIDKVLNEMGLLGWNLVSTSVTSSNGSAKALLLFFSREKQRLEELV